MRPCRRSEADELETGPNAREGWEAAVPQPSLGGRFAPISDIDAARPPLRSGRTGSQPKGPRRVVCGRMRVRGVWSAPASRADIGRTPMFMFHGSSSLNDWISRPNRCRRQHPDLMDPEPPSLSRPHIRVVSKPSPFIREPKRPIRWPACRRPSSSVGCSRSWSTSTPAAWPRSESYAIRF
jgi:hypothetical protein